MKIQTLKNFYNHKIIRQIKNILMYRKSVNIPAIKFQSTCDLPCSIVTFRGSQTQNKKQQANEKFFAITRQNSKAKDQQFFQSTFKTFGNDQDEQLINFHNFKRISLKNPNSQRLTHEKENIIRFSDFKKKENENKRYSNTNQPQQMHKYIHLCSNHPKRMAKFYINCPEKSEEKSFYCLQCTINLCQMNFNVYSMSPSNEGQDRFQTTLIKLINFKNKVNEKEQQIKKQSNFQAIDGLIKETQDKYSHIYEQLEKIKNEEIILLQVLKIKIFDQISQHQSKIQIARRRINYLIKEFDKFAKCQQKGFGIQKKWQKVYDQSIAKIKAQISNLCNIPPFESPKMPIQLNLGQIYKKLDGLYNETVHQLSFEEQQQNKRQEQNSKISEKASKLNKYLFNQDQLNSTFGLKQRIIQGVQLVQSQSNSFYDQQNIMINI